MNDRIAAPRPGRPFGLSLAIFAIMILFSIIPLMRIALDFVIIQHFNNFDWSFDADDERFDPIFSGADIQTVDVGSTVMILALSLSFLVVCVLAWRGRPAWIRYVLFFGVGALNLVNIAALLMTFLAPPDPLAGFTSADSLVRSSQMVYIGLNLLTSLYLIWYMNRAPARAFYRGYYLPDEVSGKKASPSGEVN